eukprot:TRINITY_DN21209_c0_g1_i1.p1 TRINITY_DN21209_c0_g1~~TRINITY_DN21209_c0_g1_i1.p1  ORF type:complete len:223 (+),score=96.18 TRINITY_DN21209_c0_g1_i1:82-669(+)
MGNVLCLGVDHRSAIELLFNTWRSAGTDEGGGESGLTAEHIYRHYEKQRERGTTSFHCTKAMAERLIERVEEKARQHTRQQKLRRYPGLPVQHFIFYVEEKYVNQFKELDQDEDGYIDISECIRGAGQSKRRDRLTAGEKRELIREVYKVMQLDRGDGKVSFLEFVEGKLMEDMSRTDGEEAQQAAPELTHSPRR